MPLGKLHQIAKQFDHGNSNAIRIAFGQVTPKETFADRNSIFQEQKESNKENRVPISVSLGVTWRWLFKQSSTSTPSRGHIVQTFPHYLSFSLYGMSGHIVLVEEVEVGTPKESN